MDTVYANGWGNATMYVDGVIQTKKVLVLNDATSAVPTLVESWDLYTLGARFLPLASDATVQIAYYVGFTR